MVNQTGSVDNYSRNFALQELEHQQEMAEERRRAAQRKRRQALLETKIEEFMKAYW